jgi:hypothetical protein
VNELIGRSFLRTGPGITQDGPVVVDVATASVVLRGVPLLLVVPSGVIAGPEFPQHLRQLPNGESGQLQIVVAAFSRRAVHDQIVRNFTHAGDALIDQWIACTQQATTKLAGSSQEGAEVVAVAVLGTCAGFQERLYQHLLRTKMTVSQADINTAQIQAKMREQIIAQVLTLRAKSPLR